LSKKALGFEYNFPQLIDDHTTGSLSLGLLVGDYFYRSDEVVARQKFTLVTGLEAFFVLNETGTAAGYDFKGSSASGGKLILRN